MNGCSALLNDDDDVGSYLKHTGRRSRDKTSSIDLTRRQLDDDFATVMFSRGWRHLKTRPILPVFLKLVIRHTLCIRL